MARWTIRSQFVVALFLLIAVPGQGFFDMGFNSHPSFGSVDHVAWPRSGRAFRSPHQPPCPQYKPMSVSGWAASPSGDLTLSVVLPGVHASDRRAWLEDAGRTLHIQAARPVPRQGRVCLPRDSHISRDGRHELFHTKVSMPRMVDPSKAVLQPSRSGLQIVVPRHAPVHVEHQGTGNGKVSEVRPAEARPGVSKESAVEQATTASSQHGNSPVGTSQVREQDVEVAEEDFPWPEKFADAAAGWWDNRGEFHEYGA